jgi:hypothetical protein
MVLLLRGAHSHGFSEQPSREGHGGATASRDVAGQRRCGGGVGRTALGVVEWSAQPLQRRGGGVEHRRPCGGEAADRSASSSGALGTWEDGRRVAASWEDAGCGREWESLGRAEWESRGRARGPPVGANRS